MDEVGGFASSNVLLHSRSAQAVINSANQTSDSVEDFHRPLEISFSRVELRRTRWKEAIQDPQQLKNAGLEAGRRALQGVAIVGGSVVVAAVVAKAKEDAS